MKSLASVAVVLALVCLVCAESGPLSPSDSDRLLSPTRAQEVKREADVFSQSRFAESDDEGDDLDATSSQNRISDSAVEEAEAEAEAQQFDAEKRAADSLAMEDIPESDPLASARLTGAAAKVQEKKKATKKSGKTAAQKKRKSRKAKRAQKLKKLSRKLKKCAADCTENKRKCVKRLTKKCKRAKNRKGSKKGLAPSMALALNCDGNFKKKCITTLLKCAAACRVKYTPKPEPPEPKKKTKKATKPKKQKKTKKQKPKTKKTKKTKKATGKSAPAKAAAAKQSASSAATPIKK